ncbi:glycosyl transferase [Wenjunlia vitaminophila]|uniref:Glycosyl transferase n=1 Tax=Wenjunlia vitaminophila TaxID=76728 RepID=A0A0T6LUY8_WENVI|nr:glycosyltransferase [Wenjunlia vitaminophila]KRV49950.1 glycosyl transferase [Wenjunlia vitaminophila]
MTTPLKIALVSEHASPLAALGGVDAGGQNVHVAALAGALADLGHQVTVHTRKDAGDLPESVRLRPGVTVHHVPAGPARDVPKDELLPYMGAFGDVLAELWREDPPDVAHAHYWMSGLATLRGARGSGVPVVHTFHALGTVKRRHQGDADTSPPRRVAAETAVGRACARTIATCRDEVRELRAMGLPYRRIRVVPCGVDPERFTPHGPAAPRGTRPRLLQVGRLVPRKGSDTAIAALTHVRDAELVIAGGPPPDRLHEDPEARRLTELAAEAGVADRLCLLGGVARERMPALLRSADVVICPPRYEPFGIVPLEAMACGLPVVASAVGGHLDTVADGVTGRLFPPGDPVALGAAVNELLADAPLRTRYGVAGRRRALARYRWDRVASATEAVYAEVLPRRPRGAPGSRPGPRAATVSVTGAAR